MSPAWISGTPCMVKGCPHPVFKNGICSAHWRASRANREIAAGIRRTLGEMFARYSRTEVRELQRTLAEIDDLPEIDDSQRIPPRPKL